MPEQKLFFPLISALLFSLPAIASSSDYHAGLQCAGRDSAGSREYLFQFNQGSRGLDASVTIKNYGAFQQPRTWGGEAVMVPCQDAGSKILCGGDLYGNGYIVYSLEIEKKSMRASGSFSMDRNLLDDGINGFTSIDANFEGQTLDCSSPGTPALD
jgi:hypothetical protein